MPKGGNGNGNGSTFLAVAFTDLNGNGQFDANKDALIAAVVDTNHDKIIDVGDTVQFGTYPLHLDGTAGSGTFTNTTETITGVAPLNPGIVDVTVADGNVYWQAVPEQESFVSFDPPNANNVGIADGILSPQTDHDQISVDTGVVGPGAPDTTVFELANQPGDQPFLDVFIA